MESNFESNAQSVEHKSLRKNNRKDFLCLIIKLTTPMK